MTLFSFFKRKEEKDIADRIFFNNINYILDEAKEAINLGEKTNAICLLKEANDLHDSRSAHRIIVDDVHFRLNDLIMTYIKKYGW